MRYGIRSYHDARCCCCCLHGRTIVVLVAVIIIGLFVNHNGRSVHGLITTTTTQQRYPTTTTNKKKNSVTMMILSTKKKSSCCCYYCHPTTTTTTTTTTVGHISHPHRTGRFNGRDRRRQSVVAVVAARPLGTEDDNDPNINIIKHDEQSSQLTTTTSSSSSSSSNLCWTLDMDWALIDNVSKYTISTSTETRTFWTQLWSSVPTLIHATDDPNELYVRMIQLKKVEDKHQQQQQHKEEREDGRKAADVASVVSTDHRVVGPSSMKAKKLPLFGPSPPILESWRFDFDDDGDNIFPHHNQPDPLRTAGMKRRRGVNCVIGQFVDDNNDHKQTGRTVWFHYHVIGRLQKDDPTDPSILDRRFPSTILSGGYVEAVGGRIYELGQPLQQPVHHKLERNDQWRDSDRLWGKKGIGWVESVSAPWKKKNSRSNSNDDGAVVVTTTASTGSSNNRQETTTSLGWWIPATTATVSALVSSAILSACIGYGAGLSMIEDPHQHYPPSSSTATTQMRRMVPSSSSSSSSSSYYYYSSSGRFSSSSSSSSSTSSFTTIRTKGLLPEMAGTTTAPDAPTSANNNDRSLQQPDQQRQQEQQQQQQRPTLDDEDLRGGGGQQYNSIRMRDQQLLDAINQRLDRDQQELLDEMERIMMMRSSSSSSSRNSDGRQQQQKQLQQQQQYRSSRMMQDDAGEWLLLRP